jgi:hypothetical protein
VVWLVRPVPGVLLIVSVPFGVEDTDDEPFLIAFIVIALNVVRATKIVTEIKASLA